MACHKVLEVCLDVETGGFHCDLEPLQTCLFSSFSRNYSVRSLATRVHEETLGPSKPRLRIKTNQKRYHRPISITIVFLLRSREARARLKVKHGLRCKDFKVRVRNDNMMDERYRGDTKWDNHTKLMSFRLLICLFQADAARVERG